MFKKRVSLFLAVLLLSSCNMEERLSRIGKAPDIDELNVYGEPEESEYPSDTQDYLAQEPQHIKTANSLWKPGSRTFFRDQRARSVGDILKVIVTIQDSAKLDNKTESKRNDSANTGIPNVLGFETKLGKILPGGVDASNLIGVKSTDNNSGDGKIDRKEKINTTIAATVVKILSSNNLVINGSQQIRVNNELREVTVQGIVRPEDISAQNSVTLDQIAEARISYGGKGSLSDVQQPRYGKQLLDVVSPF